MAGRNAFAHDDSNDSIGSDDELVGDWANEPVDERAANKDVVYDDNWFWLVVAEVNWGVQLDAGAKTHKAIATINKLGDIGAQMFYEKYVKFYNLLARYVAEHSDDVDARAAVREPSSPYGALVSTIIMLGKEIYGNLAGDVEMIQTMMLCQDYDSAARVFAAADVYRE
jgi:hypothetical protein